MIPQYVTPSDLGQINRILSRGNDVAIQLTKNGFRIVEKSVTVVVKREFPTPGGTESKPSEPHESEVK